ncbi:late control protein [Bordetella sp. H567]|nr:late control protein [Bordetella sp. H567]
MRRAFDVPLWRVTLGDTDLTGVLKPRLISLGVTECRAEQADQLDIELDDTDGALAIPAREAVLRVYLGFQSTGMVDKGTYTVDEVEYSGAPDTITVRARSANLTSELRTRTERSFHKQKIRDIVAVIAKAHGLKSEVATFGDVVVPHIDQTNESDIAFLNRIGKRYDAVATVKEGRLLFIPIKGGQKVDGTDLPVHTIYRTDGDKFRYHVADRDAYTGVRAFWQDKRHKTRRSVVAGVIGNAKRLHETFASESDALDAARAEWERIKRGTATMTYDLAFGDPSLSAQHKVQFPDMKQPVGETVWLIKQLRHTLNEAQGLTTSIEAETNAVDVEPGDPDDTDS